MRVTTGLTLIALLLGSPAFAAEAPSGADALVTAATTIAREATFEQEGDRIRLLLTVAEADVRRKNLPAAQALLTDAAARARALPQGASAALALVSTAEFRAGHTVAAAALLREAEGLATPAEKRAIAITLVDAGRASEADARLAGGGPVDRGRVAYAWHRAHDDIKAAARAGEALAGWRRLPPAQAGEQAPGLATALWYAGYPTLAIEVARAIPKRAWPRAVKPLLVAIGESKPSAAGKKAAAPFLEIALERCDVQNFADMSAEAELLAAIAQAFAAMEIPDRPYFTLMAADDRLTEALKNAGDQADSPAFTADRAAALVAIGDGNLRIGKGQAGLDHLRRGERLAASLDEDPTSPFKRLGGEIRATAAIARARHGGPAEPAVQVAALIKQPLYRGEAYLAIDALSPAAAERFEAETREMLKGPDAFVEAP